MLLVNKKGISGVIEVDDLLSIGINISSAPTIAETIQELDSTISKTQLRNHIKNGAVWIGDERAIDEHEDLSSGNVATAIFVGKNLIGVHVPKGGTQ